MATAATVLTVLSGPAAEAGTGDDAGRDRGLATTVRTAPAAKTAGEAPAARAAESDPLSVSIETLKPSVIPEEGTVTITGTVTNTSDETWADVNMYPALPSGALPITSAAELAAAAQVPAELVVGERKLEVSDPLGDLAPGEVAPYALRIPRRLLPTTEGVHWLSVHALGGDAAGRDGFADGRARTFIPLVRGKTKVPTALVLQLRSRIQHTSDGRVERPDQWASSLATGGRLRSVVELGAAAGDRPITWLVDPAVVSTVGSLVAGNLGRLPPRPETPEGEEGDDGEVEDPSTPDEPTDPPILDEALSGDPGDPAALASVGAEGQAWLARLQTAIAGKELLALPYGDVDASAASHHDQQALVDAQTLSATEMASLGLPAAPALASPSGFLNPEAIRSASPDTTLLVTSDAVETDRGGPRSVVEIAGHEVVLTSAGALAGGPGPDDRLATVAFRQRLLAEAAVRALGRRDPLVVVLPTDWTTTDASGFFTGLDVDFVDLAPLSEAVRTDADPAPLTTEDVRYPVFQQEFELDAANFGAADDLIGAGAVLQQVLIEGPAVGDTVSREAFTELSYWQRPRANEARAAAARSSLWIDSTLRRVTIDGPVSVTLSSATGQFPARIHNGLEQPVVVRVGAASSGGLTIDLPDEIALDPGESTRLRLSATTDQVGSHTVELYVTTSDGTRTGSSTELPIRSNQVSEIIWIVIIAGGGLLFGAIALRLFRRIRRSRAAA